MAAPCSSPGRAGDSSPRASGRMARCGGASAAPVSPTWSSRYRRRSRPGWGRVSRRSGVAPGGWAPRGSGLRSGAHEVGAAADDPAAPDGERRARPDLGQGGVVEQGVQATCGGLCRPASIQADGAIVVTGASGNGGATRRARGVRRLRHDRGARPAPVGALDSSFGLGGVVEVPTGRGLNVGGFGVALLGDGRIVVLGREPSAPLLTRLLPYGALDPTFHGGVPVGLPIPYGLRMLLHPDGFVDVISDQRLLRSRRLVSRIPASAQAGPSTCRSVAPCPMRCPLAGRGVLVYVAVSSVPGPADDGDLVLRRIAADGTYRGHHRLAGIRRRTG